MWRTGRTQRNIDRFIGSWRCFAYGEAAMGLGDLKPGDRSLADRVRVLQDLSKAFDSWDRFDHDTAAGILSAYGKHIAPAHPHLLASMKQLTTATDCRTPARLWDLWFNALRRAEQGRFDDAIARLYRLLEWTAQWLLQVRHGIDTADIPQDRLPPGHTVTAKQTRSVSGRPDERVAADRSSVPRMAAPVDSAEKN